ncbi:hypothetical protein B1400_0368 [Bifidobacterium italicum]|uniref:Holin n=1 Tax=Bifidobacterium italicum TaxID=1960968 RepID=A0A2A2ELC7_9BIFI|nr:hypothetical protein [Bifidobacterium italicum]PAU69833.1 hypothetical protein B1400_0368 [Bifidobacterium italicum]
MHRNYLIKIAVISVPVLVIAVPLSMWTLGVANPFNCRVLLNAATITAIAGISQWIAWRIMEPDNGSDLSVQPESPHHREQNDGSES